MNRRLKLALIFSTVLFGVGVVEARTEIPNDDPAGVIAREIRAGNVPNQEIGSIYKQIEGEADASDIMLTRERVATYFDPTAYSNDAFRKKETAEYLDCLTQKQIAPIAVYEGLTLSREQTKNKKARAIFFKNLTENTRKMLATGLKNSVHANEPAR